MFNTTVLTNQIADKDIRSLSEKIISGERISDDEGILLFEKAETGLLGTLSNIIRERKNANNTYFNKNFHIEPTNICIYQCKFCSYKRKMGEEGSWEHTLDDIAKIAQTYQNTGVTEVHIVGGVHPHRDLYYYGEMMQIVKQHLPNVHIKAFTAIELDYMIKKAGFTLEEGLKKLKEFGLDSIPGGGAEIFDPEIRNVLCKEKSSGNSWLTIHKTAHKCGIPTNATMLYGHIEKYHHRIDHLRQLREVQDETGGFNTFIPLKFRKENNHLSYINEITTVDDLRNYAVSRIYLDNFEHIKAYWPMIGKDVAQMSLSFGVDDVDGTIDDTTKIYSMAGVKESNTMTTTDLIDLIKEANRVPVERDTLYNVIKVY
jgi:aminodeoxyfutalosine synthase